jgi:hypothetical protein
LTNSFYSKAKTTDVTVKKITKKLLRTQLVIIAASLHCLYFAFRCVTLPGMSSPECSAGLHGFTTENLRHLGSLLRGRVVSCELPTGTAGDVLMPILGLDADEAATFPHSSYAIGISIQPESYMFSVVPEDNYLIGQPLEGWLRDKPRSLAGYDALVGKVQTKAVRGLHAFSLEGVDPQTKCPETLPLDHLAASLMADVVALGLQKKIRNEMLYRS